MKKNFPIGDIAKLLGLSTESLRHYERMGLIKPVSVRENGYRYYDMKSYTYLYFIKKYRSFGFTLPEIKEIIYDLSDDEKTKLFRKRRAELDSELATIEKQIYSLDVFINNINSAKDNIDSFDLIKTEPFWFVPIKQDEDLCVSPSQVRETKAMIDSIIDLRYTLIADLHRENGELKASRRIGFSKRAAQGTPTEGAELIPAQTALRSVIKIIDGEPIVEAFERTRVISKLEDLGIDTNRKVFGHMINLSRGEDANYAIFVIYIPVEIVSE